MASSGVQLAISLSISGQNKVASLKTYVYKILLNLLQGFTWKLNGSLSNPAIS